MFFTVAITCSVLFLIEVILMILLDLKQDEISYNTEQNLIFSSSVFGIIASATFEVVVACLLMKKDTTRA